MEWQRVLNDGLARNSPGLGFWTEWYGDESRGVSDDRWSARGKATRCSRDRDAFEELSRSWPKSGDEGNSTRPSCEYENETQIAVDGGRWSFETEGIERAMLGLLRPDQPPLASVPSYFATYSEHVSLLVPNDARRVLDARPDGACF